jgi:DNA-binding beta-propeller fold protein YncE
MFVHTNDSPRICHNTDNTTIHPGKHLPSIQLNTNVKMKPTKFMSLCLLSDKQLIVSDNINTNLQCFENIQNQTVNSVSHKLPCCPWDMTKLTDEEVAITFPDSGLIRIPTFTKSMEIKKTTEFKTRSLCYGIAYSKVIDRLAVTFTNPPEVQIIDKVGAVFKSISKDSNGETLFISPLFVAASLGGGEIYISDTGKNTVFSMSIYDINLKNSYKDRDLESPLGLTVDETGAVLVCGKNSGTIHLLSPELKTVQVLLGSRDGIKRPVGVAYSKTEKKLYVAMYGCADIKVFQL